VSSTENDPVPRAPSPSLTTGALDHLDLHLKDQHRRGGSEAASARRSTFTARASAGRRRWRRAPSRPQGRRHPRCRSQRAVMITFCACASTMVRANFWSQKCAARAGASTSGRWRSPRRSGPHPWCRSDRGRTGRTASRWLLPSKDNRLDRRTHGMSHAACDYPTCARDVVVQPAGQV
jgi:hypothetical protein